MSVPATQPDTGDPAPLGVRDAARQRVRSGPPVQHVTQPAAQGTALRDIAQRPAVVVIAESNALKRKRGLYTSGLQVHFGVFDGAFLANKHCPSMQALQTLKGRSPVRTGIGPSRDGAIVMAVGDER